MGSVYRQKEVGGFYINRGLRGLKYWYKSDGSEAQSHKFSDLPNRGSASVWSINRAGRLRWVVEGG